MAASGNWLPLVAYAEAPDTRRAVKAVLAADGVDEPNAPGDLKKAVRDCLKAHVQPG